MAGRPPNNASELEALKAENEALRERLANMEAKPVETAKSATQKRAEKVKRLEAMKAAAEAKGEQALAAYYQRKIAINKRES